MLLLTRVSRLSGDNHRGQVMEEAAAARVARADVGLRSFLEKEGIMRKAISIVAVCATVLWTGAAQAAGTPQQECSSRRS